METANPKTVGCDNNLLH